MISLDASTFFALLLAAALGGVLVGVLPPWRRLMSGRDLPLRRFLGQRRPASVIDAAALLEAELRCSLCGERAACDRRLSAGDVMPAASCPNGALLRAQETY